MYLHEQPARFFLFDLRERRYRFSPTPPYHYRKNDKLVTFDIVSLYTNIPVELGIQAVQFWIGKYPNLINDRFTQNFILEGLKIVLNNNTFSFDDKHYLQTKGTAMGTKVAPTYATLTLGYFEFLLQTEILNLWGEDSANYISKHWKRFLDDCFIIWNQDDERLYTFYNILNKLDPNIKFTMEESLIKYHSLMY